MSMIPDILLDRFRSGASDLVGIDVGASGIKAVRMQKGRDTLTLSAAQVLPALSADKNPAETGLLTGRLLPEIKARHACLAVSSPTAVVKLLSFPGQVDSKIVSKLAESLGLKNPNHYRLGYEIIQEGQAARSESRILAAALPEAEAETAVNLLSAGIPVPSALEISGLATLTAFLHATQNQDPAQAVGVIEFGASTSTFALFNRRQLALVRRFRFGTNHLVAKLSESLGLDMETAGGIIANNSFDISNTVNDAIEYIVKQLVVSRDFVERRENCHVATLYVSGGLVHSHDAVERMKLAMGIEVQAWNPLENLKVAEDAIPENLADQSWRLASAIGACIGAFETS